jgi:hypothetical protein
VRFFRRDFLIENEVRQANLSLSIIARRGGNAISVGETIWQNPGVHDRGRSGEQAGPALSKAKELMELRRGQVLVKVVSKWRAGGHCELSRMDLLTVLEHEVGHLLGREHATTLTLQHVQQGQ